MQKQGPVVAWIVDDTGFPKKGKHSVGVTRQYCGQVGKQENCRVAVSLSIATWSSSLPIAYRLYLPKEWAADAERREQTEVPEEIEFQTKPDIALDQIRTTVAADLARGVVLADAAYGMNTDFRDGLTALGLQYVVGVQSSMTVWEPGQQPLPAKPRGKNRTTSAAIATVHRSSTGLSEAVGDEFAIHGLQRNHVAGRHRSEVAIPLRRRAGTRRSSGLRESGTSRGGMVADRMAARGGRTH
jgi:SRSO17 transposase